MASFEDIPLVSGSIDQLFADRSAELKAKATRWKAAADRLELDPHPTTLSEALRGGRGRIGKICLHSTVDETGARIYGVPIDEFADMDSTAMAPLLYLGKRLDPASLEQFRKECFETAARHMAFDAVRLAVKDNGNGDPMECLINTVGLLPLNCSTVLESFKCFLGVQPYLIAMCYKPKIGNLYFGHSKTNDPVAKAFCYYLFGNSSNDQIVSFVNAYLNLLASHSVNLSQTVAQAIASGKGSVKQVLRGGLNALATPAHGGAQARIMAMGKQLIDFLRLEYDQIPTREQLALWAADRLQNGLVFDGFGHAVIKGRHDPRAVKLRSIAEQIPGIKDEWEFKLFAAIQDELPAILQSPEMLKIKKINNPYINVDFWAGPLQQMILGVSDPRSFVLLFAFARSADYLVAKLFNDDLGLAIVREDSVDEAWIDGKIATLGQS